ncbi:GNAT family N-acetyltransferase [Pseudomonas sp. LPB0260]|uniref:GNAT family N-acetyltransferase n=1 Tax=Pseudomonas sp. LPB0260 TaxID=2614442 RepID=UPI0015C25674|nr:GNAT family N-acetyltransferase [Pseudomonas sp. LPB0260]QLC73153.1 GNAT family N-acetyltransferase [Pseudomonas sp. LPB0260]QLC75927.1 GNAT family N-acetyltransferase [Pseudomonas sp. LPB0260]
MAIEIHPIGAADHAAWLALWQGYLDFYRTALPAETSAVTWQRFLDPAEPTHAALAWRDGQAVGLVQWIFHRSNWSVENSCYLQDLYVAADSRGNGIGRRLIEHVYAQARDAGASRVHWLTQESNGNAMRLYQRIAERSGFVQYRKNL